MKWELEGGQEGKSWVEISIKCKRGGTTTRQGARD